MKHVILMIVLAVLKESYPLNPEILKYDQYMKDFETTGRQLKREKNKEMNPLIVKREDQKHEDRKLDITVSQPTKNGVETLLHTCLRAEGFQGKDLEELTAGQRGQVVGCMNKEHEHLNAEINKTNIANIKDIIMMLCRSDYENFELVHLPPITLSKQDMINEIQKSVSKFQVPTTLVKKEDLKLHYLRMRYILLTSQHQDVIDFKNYLNGKNIDDDLIAKYAAIFYSQSSGIIHSFDKPVTLKDIEIALKAHGIDEKNILIAQTIFAIQKGIKNELPN